MKPNEHIKIFIGSSSEGIPIAEAIQENLATYGDCDTVIWSQGVFGLGQGTMEALVEELPTFDFAILVLTADDLVQSRGETKQSARDNVLLEFGLCVGVLGRKRTFAIYDRTAQIRIPSDLAGVTLATYRPHQDGNFQASLGETTSKIKRAFRDLGPRAPGSSEVCKGAFLAVPMNAFNVAGRPAEFQPFREEILSLVEILRNDCGIGSVFCAMEGICDVKEFDHPGASLALDLEKIHETEFFIAICMRDVTSKSVLIEIGMALAMGKKCIICVESGAVLPFILLDASSAVANVRKVEYETINKLAHEMKRNKSWLFKFARKEVQIKTPG